MMMSNVRVERAAHSAKPQARRRRENGPRACGAFAQRRHGPLQRIVRPRAHGLTKLTCAATTRHAPLSRCHTSITDLLPSTKR